jgi:crossover junction endodeoxyribonuclease RuvC
MTRILGIDPGSRLTGYGIIERRNGRDTYIEGGCIRIEAEAWPERLRIIFEGVSQLVDQHRPDEMAIEKVFMHRNADSALKLGQARGAAICALVARGLPVSEYTPTEIKQAVVGKGNAAKQQVQHMIRALLKLTQAPQADCADALAVALCHANTRDTLNLMPGVKGMRGGRYL